MSDQQTDTQHTGQPDELSHEQLDVVSGGPLECALYYADGFMDPRSPERRTPRVLDTMEGGDGI